MKRIPLTQGKFALVDDADFKWLSRYKWCAWKAPRTWYVRRLKDEFMHRRILGLQKGDGIEVDHRNGNGLDNQRHNLRICTRSENTANQRMPKNNTSGYKGVSWDIDRNKWRVMIDKNGKHIYVGLYFCLIKAARAYDSAAVKYFGEYANLNFPDEVKS